MATFTWVPSYNASATRKPRVLATKFGDGYEQRVGDGINTNPRDWSLSFEGRKVDEADSIEAFLIARGGFESFDWTDPHGVAGKFVCREWSRIIVAPQLFNITAKFDEVFE